MIEAKNSLCKELSRITKNVWKNGHRQVAADLKHDSRIRIEDLIMLIDET